MRPAWIEVHLEAVKQNIRSIKSVVGDKTQVMAVTKANGYGHGLIEISRSSLQAGATMLGAAILDEALALRENGIKGPILTLGCPLPDQAPDIVNNYISHVVTNIEAAEFLSREAVKRDIPAKVHIKIDTGMGRIGVTMDKALSYAQELTAHPGIEIEGVMMHFPSADQPDLSFSRQQIGKFSDVLSKLSCAGIAPKWIHTANSAAIAFLPESHFDMVRPGLLIYGIPPTPESCDIPLRPAMTIKARITQIRSVPKGQNISYGRSFVTKRKSVIGIVPLGYGDGYSRAHSNRGKVLVKGTFAPILGRVCMDQFVVDLTDIPQVELGEEVVVMGRQKENQITTWDVAEWMNSVPHEVVSALGTRLPRVFTR